MCQRAKSTVSKRKGELKYLKPSRPNEIVTMDIAGPFPISNLGNSHILIIVCAFTKFSRAIGMHKTTAEVIAAILID
ncbi:unnamed protein product [Brachionus calyciflorus]|uniref:Integrase catalytic domain-containing protein n=1 Tax=Brachionus calyciflorus TaxID=104777 RepID=A0A814AC92_9BILA|nr:unnamed protein product [Brachionus calyciflorus]